MSTKPISSLPSYEERMASYEARREAFQAVIDAEKPSAIFHVGDPGTGVMSMTNDAFKRKIAANSSFKTVSIDFHEGMSDDGGASLKKAFENGLSQFSQDALLKPLFMINFPELRIGHGETEVLAAGLKSMSEMVAERGGSLVVNSNSKVPLQWAAQQISDKLPVVNVGSGIL